MLRGVIAEDNAFTRAKLVEIIGSFGVEILYCTGSGEELLEFLKNKETDLIFLDIGLPGLSGIEVANCIRRHYPFTDIIFITSHDKYIKAAVELYATDYITKPLNVARLKSTIERLKQKYMLGKTLELSSGDEIVLVQENDIYMVEALRRRVKVYSSRDILEADHTLKEMQSLLCDNFFRTSRSFLVNVNKVTSVRPCSRTSFELQFGNYCHKAYLSKNLYEDFRSRIKVNFA